MFKSWIVGLLKRKTLRIVTLWCKNTQSPMKLGVLLFEELSISTAGGVFKVRLEVGVIFFDGGYGRDIFLRPVANGPVKNVLAALVLKRVRRVLLEKLQSLK